MVVRTALWTIVRDGGTVPRCRPDGVGGSDGCPKVQLRQTWSARGIAGGAERPKADVDHLGLRGVQCEGEHSLGLVQGFLGLVHVHILESIALCAALPALPSVAQTALGRSPWRWRRVAAVFLDQTLRLADQR